MREIRLALAGVGNCASSLIQGLEYYKDNGGEVGLLHPEVGGYRVGDIKVVAAFDIDTRKVGLDLSEAVFAEPNKAPRMADLGEAGVVVEMGPILDSPSPDSMSLIKPANLPSVDVAGRLRESRADVFLNLVSGGAVNASDFYAHAALETGCGFINATPNNILGKPELVSRFSQAGVPLAGDDLMSQIGATALHIGILEFLVSRGVKVSESYQLDVGGGSESIDTLERTRNLKREIKTQAVKSHVPYDFSLVSGSSDFVDFLVDGRDSFLYLKGRYFGGAEFSLDLKLGTQDSPNAGGILVDVIRGLKVAKDRGLGGPINEVCSYGFKRPPIHLSLGEALRGFRGFTGCT